MENNDVRKRKFRIAATIIILLDVIVLLAVLIYRNDPSSIIPHQGLERVIREQINKPSGVITKEDCLGITELHIGQIPFFSNLEGLQYFTDLEMLECHSWSVSDISSLQGLYKLKELDLDNNKIKDLTPLSALTNLEELKLYNNNVHDLTPLAPLTNLKDLVIGKNPAEYIGYIMTVTDIGGYDRDIPASFAPLAHLEGLEIGSYADYAFTVKDSSFVDSNTLPDEEENVDYAEPVLADCAEPEETE